MIQTSRLRLVLKRHRRLVAGLLVAVAAVLLLLAAWTALAPATETVTEQTDSRSVSTELHHSAVVRANDAPWDAGTELEDHPAYLRNASPVLDLRAETVAPPGTSVNHTVRLELRVEREGEVVWERSEALARGEHTIDGESATTTASLDVDDVAERISRAERQFAGVGGVDSRIVVDTAYETGGYEGRLAGTAGLSVSGNFYWLSGDAAASQVHTDSRTIDRTEPVDWSWIVGLLVLSGLAGGGALAVTNYRIDDDFETLELAVQRDRFEDWISRGSIPLDVGRDYVALDSLPDLVDVAIDTGRRVVHDERRGVYAVIGGEVVYFYAPDGSWASIGERGDSEGSVSGPVVGPDGPGSNDPGDDPDGDGDGVGFRESDRARTDGSTGSVHPPTSSEPHDDDRE